MKSLKLSDYFQIVRPEYVYLRLKPTTSIRNYNSDKIAKAVTAMHRNMNQQFRRRGHTIFFDKMPKTAYFIYIEKGKVEFYLIVPKLYVGLMKERITDTWNSITITEEKELPTFENPVSYYLTYAKEDALSLAVDRRNNDLLASTLNVIEVMESGDKVGIYYNFIPTSQFTWRSEHDATIAKIKAGQPVDRNKMSAKYISKATLMVVLDAVNLLFNVLGDLFGNKEIAAGNTFNIHFTDLSEQKWSKATAQKKERQVLETQILVQSQSVDGRRADNNAVSVCESFQSITEDNTLIYKRCRPRFTATRIKGVESIKASVDECGNFIALPGRELLEQHNCIEKVDTIESEVPDELRQGVMCIGTNTHKGKQTKAYLTEDREYRNLSLCIIGPNRSGKSTLIGNLCKDGQEHGEVNILFDFCGNCELSDEVSAHFKNVLNIDCANADKLQGLGYNEVKPGKNTFERYRNAKIQTSQLLTLVNSINADDSDLRARMERYLEAASVIVFLSGGSIKDVFAVLQDHNLRAEYIDRVEEEQQENTFEYISALHELDDKSKSGEVTGTKMAPVQGILNRANRLKQNTYLELMLKKDCTGNIDLVNEIQKSQLICLRMPEVMFSTESEKDIYCTYWLTKIWLALQIRKWEHPDLKDRLKVNIFIDELYQVPQAQDFLRSKLSQMPKFTAKPIISCHYLGQIPIIRNELKAANTSYMLIAGADKDNFLEMKSELYPYTVEDVLNMKRYHSLNLLKTNNGYARFITQLPKPI